MTDYFKCPVCAKSTPLGHIDFHRLDPEDLFIIQERESQGRARGFKVTSERPGFNDGKVLEGFKQRMMNLLNVMIKREIVGEKELRQLNTEAIGDLKEKNEHLEYEKEELKDEVELKKKKIKELKDKAGGLKERLETVRYELEEEKEESENVLRSLENLIDEVKKLMEILDYHMYERGEEDKELREAMEGVNGEVVFIEDEVV